MIFSLRKHWTTIVGLMFILISFISLFSYSVDKGWVTDELKIGIGLASGGGLILAGLQLFFGKKWRLVSEMVSGLGVALIYTTLSFAGITYAIWDSMTVFLCMLALTSALGWFSYRFGLRILMFIGLAGALLAPMMLRPETDQVFTLFLYLLVLNTVFFFVSIRKEWLEERCFAFVGTWIMYAVYYFQFDPEVSGAWSMPCRYAYAAFLFYVIASFIAAWVNRQKFDGIDLYMGLLNGLMFGVWVIVLLDGIVPFAYPLACMGLVYLLAAYLVYRITRSITLPVMLKAGGGLFLLFISASQMGKGMESRPIVSVFVWGTIAAVLLLLGHVRKLDVAKLASTLIWIVITGYWYLVTWDTPRLDWFDSYVPFLNWAAMAWVLLAVIGFTFSKKVRFGKIDPDTHYALSVSYSVISHFIVGGLLTIQMENLFDFYDFEGVSLALTLSISWGVYAVLLFLWGAYSRQRFFRFFGSAVLIVVAVKTIAWDLADEDSIYKIIVFFALGLLSFAISLINHAWQKSEEAEKPQEPMKAGEMGDLGNPPITAFPHNGAGMHNGEGRFQTHMERDVGD